MLKPEATPAEVDGLCKEALEYNFASVCVNPGYVTFARDRLKNSAVKVCSVIGFPLGATTTGSKVHEAEEAISNGAQEVDMVINIGRLKSGDLKYVEADVRAVVNTAHARSTITKVIIETCLLTDEEKEVACTIAKKAGADFVKTSTGFSKSGATAADVALMRRVVGPSVGVKASGGVRNYADAVLMIQSGANRIGTSSGVKIILESKQQ
ncbi:MAG TPA: deoxyribose-phosphate aldolase [Candidatus Kryptobacter bacterium]|nr:deoxyribose-phosphate aldolase [Candidatus Kryptobacter bacterium]